MDADVLSFHFPLHLGRISTRTPCRRTMNPRLALTSSGVDLALTQQTTSRRQYSGSFLLSPLANDPDSCGIWLAPIVANAGVYHPILRTWSETRRKKAKKTCILPSIYGGVRYRINEFCHASRMTAAVPRKSVSVIYVVNQTVIDGRRSSSLFPLGSPRLHCRMTRPLSRI